eukprot:2004629-Ditylum_brightwellii.AAC.1
MECNLTPKKKGEYIKYHHVTDGTISPSSMSLAVQYPASSSKHVDSIDPIQSEPNFRRDTPFGMDVAVQNPISTSTTPARVSCASPRQYTTSVGSLESAHLTSSPE